MNKEKTGFKIAIVGDTLSGGGAEQVHARLSQFLYSKNIEVHNIIFNDKVEYEYKGFLKNLGKIPDKTKINKLQKVYALRNYFRQHQFDFVIDFRCRVNNINELLIFYFGYNCPVIYTVRSGIIEYYIPKNTFVKRLIYKKAKAILTVSNRITELLKKDFKIPVVTIYNPLDLEKIKNLSTLFTPEEENYILAVGRMNDKVKQFDKLIEAYSDSVLPQRDVQLLILGEGQYLDELKLLVKQKKLVDKVIFKGYQTNPQAYQKNALFSVLSSKNEGFPNVIIESLAVDTPVISFDCFAGPSEIIQHQQNGLLVEDQNVGKLAEAMNLMVEDQKLYQFCKQNAANSIQKFAIENIGQQWLDLLQITTNYED